jgi:cytochrome P450
VLIIAKDIYQNPRLAKARVFENTAVTPGVYSLFNVVDKRTHSFKRKLIGQCTSERSMRLFETTMLEQIEISLRTLLSSAGKSVNMTPKCKRLGIDIVSLLAFGFHLNTQTDPTYRYLIDAHVFGNFRSNLFVQFPFLKATRIYSLLERLAAKEVRRYWKAIEGMIATRVAEGKHARHDLYALIADQINPDGEHLKDSEIWAEAVFFFPAGAETTATLLCAAFFYLSRYPAAYKKLAEEIRTTFRSSDEIRSGPKLAGCEYLRACIDESLRISPPGSGTSWRELSAEDNLPEPLVVDGCIIPPGVRVGVNIYTLQ